MSVKQFLRHSADIVIIRLRSPLSLEAKEMLQSYAKQRSGETYGMKHFGYAVSEYMKAHYFEKNASLAEKQINEYCVRNNLEFNSGFQNCAASILQPLLQCVPTLKHALEGKIGLLDQERMGVIPP